MDSASRHAQRLAHNFLDDLDTMQRASRARDKRAMSHFDGGVAFYPSSNDWLRRRRSLTFSIPRLPYRSSLGTTSIYSQPVRSMSHDWTTSGTRPMVYTRYIPPVMMVGKSYFNRPTYPNYYNTRGLWYEPPETVYSQPYIRNLGEKERFTNEQIVSNPIDPLPTSSLKAHSPPRKSILTPEEPIPRVIHSTVSRRVPHRGVRLTSVPPSVPLTTATTSASYRPMIYTTESSLPPVAPTSYYRTRRYVTETPYYTTSYVEPATTKYRTYTSVTPAPSYTYYYYPPVGKPYSSIRRYGSQGSLSNEMLSERKRIEGYGPGIVYPEGSQVSELRGRIKRLLCRSKQDPHYYRYLPK